MPPEMPVDVVGAKLGPQDIVLFAFLLLLPCGAHDDVRQRRGLFHFLGLEAGEGNPHLVCAVLFAHLGRRISEKFVLR